MLRNLLRLFKGRRLSAASNGRWRQRQKRLGVESLEIRKLLSVTLSLSGTQSLVGGTNINVSNDSNAHQSEMTVDINPTNPLNLAGFSHHIGSHNEIDVFYSSNGGSTWSTTRIDDGSVGTDDGLGSGVRFDPSIAYDAAGNLYVAYGHWGSTNTRLVVARSTNGGSTFTQFTVVDNLPNYSIWPGLDKWHLATGYEPNQQGNAIVVAYDQLATENGFLDQRVVVSGSRDSGATFTTPLVINDGSIGANRRSGEFFADPALGPNGEFYVTWHDATNGTIKFDVDSDGLWTGTNNFGTDSTVVTMNQSLAQTYVPAQPGRGIYTGPVLDVDCTGGTYDGRLYLTYVDVASGNSLPDSDVFMIYTANGGTSWSSTITVEGCSGTDILPWVDVDQTTGSVNVIYYTTDNDPSANNEVDVRMASSFNGAASFGVRTDLTSAMSNAGASGYSGDFLEYIGLAVHDGTIHGLWSDNRPAGDPPTYQSDHEAYAANGSFSSSTNANELVVTGTSSANTITVRSNSDNGSFVEVVLDGTTEFAGLAATIDKVKVYGQAGDDTIDLSDLDTDLNVTVYGEDGADSITGSSYADQIEGGAGDDTLAGGDGSDNYVFAGGSLGDDSVTETGGGADLLDFSSFGSAATVNIGITSKQTVAAGLSLTLSTGTGIERVYGSASADSITGNSLANYLWGGGGDDTISSGEGNDYIWGQQGDDYLVGGSGSDYYNFGGTDLGTDTLNETSGTGDRLTFSGMTSGCTVDISDVYVQEVSTHLELNLNSATAIERVYGSGHADSITGNILDNYISAGSGNDTVSGGFGDDTIYGGPGDDSLAGDQNEDSIDGGDGDDSITGGTQDDRLHGGPAGDDTVHGNDGDDSIWGGDDEDSGGTGDYLYGGNDHDEIRGDGSQAGYGYDYGIHDVIEGGAGEDTIYGDAGNDTINGNGDDDSILGEDGDDFIEGDAGNDTIYAGESEDTAYGGAGDDYISGEDGDDELYGEDGYDTVDGDAGDDEIYGGSQNDSLSGGDGDDRLYASYGNDYLSGEDGDDTLRGGPGPDTLVGGDDNDKYLFTGSSDLGSDVVTETGGTADALDFDGLSQGVEIHIGVTNSQSYGAGTLTLNSDTAIENVYGSDNDDEIIGNNLANSIFANNGDDTVDADDGADYIEGGDGDDEIEGGYDADTIDGGEGENSLYGDSGADSIDGGSDPDYIEGGSEADTINGGGYGDCIYGGSGDDHIDGGTGDDSLLGGSGNDRYIFTGSQGLGDDSIGDDSGTADLVDFTGLSVGVSIHIGYTGSQSYGAGYLTFSNGSAIEDVTGSDNADYINGNSLSNSILGNGGNDCINGNNGSDSLYGGTGHDCIRGGDGSDCIWGEDNNDTLYGDYGNDYLNGGKHADSVFGGSGDDRVWLTDDPATSDYGNGGDGTDSVWYHKYTSPSDTVNGFEVEFQF